MPNLTSDLIHTFDSACRDLLLTQKLLIQFATTGLLALVLVLHAAIWRRLSVWPLLASLAMHHMAFSYGFENFVLALPPALLGLALWFVLRERSDVQRLVAMTPVVGAIYVLHLYAFAFLYGTIALLEVSEARMSVNRA